MDFKSITSEKYLQYFSSHGEHSISDPEMTEFLNDMITTSEGIAQTVPPAEIIKESMRKCSLEGSPYDAVLQIANSELLGSLTALEAFALLWFVSCKNSLAYQEEIYLRYANNGVIGKLLSRLA